MYIAENATTHSSRYKTPIRAGYLPISKEALSLSVIIPCYNELATLPIILEKVTSANLPESIQKEIIVVNDCSTDDTDIIMQEYMVDHPFPMVKYIRHAKNQGKGAAIQTGISLATGNYLLIQDADLEYDPNEYSDLLKPLLNGYADVVYGSRFMGGNAHRILFFWHSIGNRILTFLSNICTNLNLTDMETGYKVFKTEVLKQIVLKENRFGFEPEVTAKISRLSGIRIYEVGISYYGRTYKEGKKIKWRDGVATIFCIIKYSLFASPLNQKKEIPKIILEVQD